VLEIMPGLDFLQSCCGGDETAPESDFGKKAPCSVIESGHYKLEDDSNTAANPDAQAFEVIAGDGIREAPEWLQPFAAPATTPLLARPWQFLRRAALPIRAPCFPG
jgi:hypothetical protein